MSNPRASVELRRAVMGQIRALRRRIDPRLLERVREAVYATEHPEPLSEKDSARAAVAAFLANRADGGAFRAKLADELEQAGRNLDALLPPAAGTPPAGTPSTGSNPAGNVDRKPLARARAESSDPAPTPKAAPKPAPKPAKAPPPKKRLFWGWF